MSIHFHEPGREPPGDGIDILFVTGDAYADHPSNGVAVLSRLLDAHGYHIGIIDQPPHESRGSMAALGTPRLCAAVTAGLMDSMVANYTPLKRVREDESTGYPGVRRPDRATIAYTHAVRRDLKGVPVVIGGIEASLRRFAHYDYWQNTVRRSILIDSKADILVYGMGERQMLEMARRLKDGAPLSGIRGTCTKEKKPPEHCISLPPFIEVSSDKKAFMRSFLLQEGGMHPLRSPPLAESYGAWHVVQHPPSVPLCTAEMDALYELPFTRRVTQTPRGRTRAIEGIQFSIIAHRGCFGSCSFCSLAMHQGTVIQSRSQESILREARSFLSHPDFKGIIDDVGGPTANMYGMGCGGPVDAISVPSIIDGSPVTVHIPRRTCGRTCLNPVCPSLRSDHGPYREVLAALRSLPGVRHVFVHSGIRHDLALGDPAFLDDLCAHHVSGQLKIAPEHADPGVLAAMNKPPVGVYHAFRKAYEESSRRAGKKQYIVPYLMVAHPCSTPAAGRMLQRMLKDHDIPVEQVQVFTPTPMTLSTAMYHTGLDRHMRAVYVPYGYGEKKEQKRWALGARKIK